jgi:hypothetical protein
MKFGADYPGDATFYPVGKLLRDHSQFGKNDDSGGIRKKAKSNLLALANRLTLYQTP